MNSLGEQLVERLCAAGIVKRPSIDRIAVKEIAVFRKLIPCSVAVLLASFLTRAVMYAQCCGCHLFYRWSVHRQSFDETLYMYLCIAVGNAVGQLPYCGVCDECQAASWYVAL